METSLIRRLRPLPLDVLRVVVLEAEARVSAQLQIATAADQRSMTFAGFTIASATAASTGFLYLIESQSQNAWFFIGVLTLVFGLLMSTACALYSVWAQPYCPPGQIPSNWVPTNWENGLHSGRRLKDALLEQCHCLQKAATDNAGSAKKVGKWFNAAMAIALASISASIIVIVVNPY
jgi:hypothetical protein